VADITKEQARLRLNRRNQSALAGALARSLSRSTNALVVGQHQLRPTYRISDVFDNTTVDDWLNARLAIAAADASEAATPRTWLSWAGAVRVMVKNAAGGTRTSIDVQPWVKAGDVFVKLGTVVTIPVLSEARIEGTSYRDVKLQVTALAGGAGNVELYAGGEV